MKQTLSLILAILACAALALPANAEKMMTGYVTASSNSEIIPGIEPAGLMIDPTVVMKRHKQVKRAKATRRVNNSRMIAVVPFDYKDQYNVGAFDSRRGKMNCSMKGVYARCVYNKQH